MRTCVTGHACITSDHCVMLEGLASLTQVFLNALFCTQLYVHLPVALMEDALPQIDVFVMQAGKDHIAHMVYNFKLMGISIWE